MPLMIYFQLYDLEIAKGYNLNSEKVETWHGILNDQHNMCAKFERITAKTGCTSCTNWTISFKVQRFHTKTHVLQRHFIFLRLFQLKTFLHPTCNIQSHILKIQPFLTSFAIFHAFNDLFSAK